MGIEDSGEKKGKIEWGKIPWRGKNSPEEQARERGEQIARGLARIDEFAQTLFVKPLRRMSALKISPLGGRSIAELENILLLQLPEDLRAEGVDTAYWLALADVVKEAYRKPDESTPE